MLYTCGQNSIVTRTGFGDSVAVSLSKEYLKSLEENEDFNGGEIHVEAELYAKDVDHSDANRLNTASAIFYVNRAVAKYEREQDRFMLPGEVDCVEGPGRVYVLDSEHPSGWNEDYKILRVEVIRDEPLDGEGGNVLADIEYLEYGTEGSYDYAALWYYTAQHCGKAVIEVTYEDIYRKVQSYEFTVYVTNDKRRVEICIEDRSQYALPGSSKQLKAEVIHKTIGDVEQNDDDLYYEWKLIDNGDQYYASIEGNGDQATVTFQEPSDPNSSYYKRIGVELILYTNGDEGGKRIELNRDNVWIEVTRKYYAVRTSGINESLGIGDSEEIRVFLAKYTYSDSSGGMEYEVVPDAHFIFGYDPETVEIADEKGNIVGYGEDGEYHDSDYTTGSECTFTIRRLTGSERDISIQAKYTDDDSGNECITDAANFHLRESKLDLFFNNKGDEYELRNDEEKAFKLNNIDSLGDLNYKIVYNVGYMEMGEDGEDYWRLIFDANIQYIDDQTQHSVVVNGEKVWDAIELHNTEQGTDWDSIDIQAIVYLIRVNGLTRIGDTVCRVKLIGAAKESQTISAQDISIAYSESEKINVDGAHGTLSFASSNDAVATVGNDGVVTAKAPGTAVITISADETEDYLAAEPIQIKVTVSGLAIGGQKITVSPSGFIYDGKAKTPAVSVSRDGTNLKEDTDYTVSYANNTDVGTATITIIGIENYEGTATATFQINAASITTATVSGLSAKTYTGSAITQTPTVKIGTTTLKANTDYTVSYTNNTNAGTATVKITGKGNYTGTKTATFTINKAAQSITAKSSASSIAVGKTATVSITGAKGTKSYKSSDTTIATVTSAGKVTAKKVGTVKITATSASTTNYKAASKTVTIKVVPAATTSLTAVNQATGIKLSWSKVTGANGYKVYRGSTLVKTITSGSTVTYTDTKANTNGTKYTFKIVAKAATGDSTLNKSVVAYRVARPAISSVTNSAAGKMTIKWGKNAKATGYQIQYSTSKTFASGNKAVSVTSASTVSKVIGSLTKGKTYYVRIRTYKTVGSTKYWSAWSVAKTVKISK